MGCITNVLDSTYDFLRNLIHSIIAETNIDVSIGVTEQSKELSINDRVDGIIPFACIYTQLLNKNPILTVGLTAIPGLLYLNNPRLIYLWESNRG